LRACTYLKELREPALLALRGGGDMTGSGRGKKGLFPTTLDYLFLFPLIHTIEKRRFFYLPLPDRSGPIVYFHTLIKIERSPPSRAFFLALALITSGSLSSASALPLTPEPRLQVPDRASSLLHHISRSPGRAFSLPLRFRRSHARRLTGSFSASGPGDGSAPASGSPTAILAPPSRTRLEGHRRVSRLRARAVPADKKGPQGGACRPV
jgi:hypothetical protein